MQIEFTHKKFKKYTSFITISLVSFPFLLSLICYQTLYNFIRLNPIGHPPQPPPARSAD